MPFLLVTIPVLIVLALASWTVALDDIAAQSRAIQETEEALQSYATQLGATAEQFSFAQLRKVSKRLSRSEDPVLSLRALVQEGQPAFAAYFDTESRIFPPENTGEQLWRERVALSELDSTIFQAKVQAQVRPDGKAVGTAWGKLDGAPSIVTCEVGEEHRLLCVAATLPKLTSLFNTALQNSGLAFAQPPSLIDPWGQQQWPDEEQTETSLKATLELGAPLLGWKIRANVSPPRASHGSLLLASLILATVGWGIALVLLMRYQVQSVQQHRDRAESAARLSHDLRTPIANLAIYADLVRRHGQGNSEISRCCVALQEEVARLAIIAEETLRRSRGQVSSNARSKVAAADKVIGNLAAQYSPLMARAGCEIQFEAGAPDVFVADKLSLERIVINLLDNVRMHASGSRVTVTTRRVADDILLSVCDEGEDRSALKSNDVASNGLGLKVVEEIAHATGGTYKASIDKTGSRFDISLPAQTSFTT